MSPEQPPLTAFGPDFPFPYDDWLTHPAGLGRMPPDRLGSEVVVVGAGIAGLVAAYELMCIGLRPVVYESSHLGGRLRSQPFEGADGIVAELGGMRFPRSSTAFHHYVDLLGLDTAPFPNPLTEAAGSTVIDLHGRTYYGRTLADLPPFFTEVADAWASALEEGAGFTDLQQAIRERDTARIRALWAELVEVWDDRTFYDFVSTSKAFSDLSFAHREAFGQVGFGTGGWDSDFPNSMLEILRVVLTGCEDDQLLVVGGVEQVPQGLWTRTPPPPTTWCTGPPGPACRRCTGAGPARASPGCTGSTRTRSASPTSTAAPATCPRCSPPARAGCCPPRSTPTSRCSARSCGWPWTAPGTCSRPRRS